MKVVYVNPPVLLGRQFFHYPLFSNLGVLQGAAVARAAGHDVRIVDAMYLSPRLRLEDLPGGRVRRLGATAAEVAERVEAESPDVVFVYASMYNHPERWDEVALPQVLSALRRALPRCRVGLNDCFVGGLSYYPYDAEALLRAHPELDFALTLETERTSVSFLKRLQAGQDMTGLPGLAFRRPDGSVSARPAGPGDRVKDLDELPDPAWDLLDMDVYFRVQAEAFARDLIHEYPEQRRILPMIGSRGCPSRCLFCQNSVLKLAWRGLSASRLIAQIDDLCARFRPDVLFFLDDSISVDRRRFDRVVDHLAARRMPWDAVNGIRADHITRGHIDRMVEAGCPKLTTSGESADDRVMEEVVRKNLRKGSIDRLADAAWEAGLRLQVHWVIGMPGETRADMCRTLHKAVDLLERRRVHPLVMHAVPSPGTLLREQVIEAGFIAAGRDGLALQDEYSVFQLRTPEFDAPFVDRAMAVTRRLVATRLHLPRLVVSDRSNNDWPFRDALPAAPVADDELDAVLARLARTGARGVVLCGDDPTADLRHLLSIVGRAVVAGLKRVWVRTNARAFSYMAVAHRFAEAGLWGVEVEFPSDEATSFDRVAGVPGAFGQTAAGVENLAREGVRVVLGATVLASTADRLPGVLAFARTSGARALLVRKPKPFSARRDLAPEVLDHAGFLAALERLEAAAAPGDPPVHVVGVPACLVPRWRDRVRNDLDLTMGEERDWQEAGPACDRCPDSVCCRRLWGRGFDRLYREREHMPSDPDRVLLEA